MNKFNVGDNVICEKAHPGYVRGRQYTILNVDENGFIQVGLDGIFWTPDKFSLVEKPDARKESDGKPRMDIVMSIKGLDSVADVFGYGAKKYDDYNWRKDNSAQYKMKLIAACVRHVYKWCAGEKNDPETGKNHLAHAACNLLMVLDLES